ncbi:MAG: UDP-N-acetylmuramate dehydrogenase [bacterium]|jgi:UDP-N-acetylmuramate dehydrogenase
MLTVRSNVSLKKLNTFGVEATAERYGSFSGATEIKEWISENSLPEKVLVLGAGSNLLFTGDYDGLVLKNDIRGIRIISQSDDEVLLEVGGGENWSGFVDFTLGQGWSGVENLSLIPGTVGAAPVQNIGAYGVELQEVFVGLEALDLHTGKFEVFDTESCEFGYRTSLFKTHGKGRYIILSVRLRLRKKLQPNLSYAPLKSYFQGREPDTLSAREISEAVRQIRRSKLPDPEVIGNAGSFFKNPVVTASELSQLQSRYPEIPVYKIHDDEYKLAAGWLIEKCGWKGKRAGDAGVHDRQALVLVNHGKATGKEIKKLADQIRENISSVFGIKLESEVTIL